MRILCSVFSASASKSPHNVRRFRSLFSAGRLIINVISSLQDGAGGEVEHARYPSLAAEINLRGLEQRRGHARTWLEIHQGELRALAVIVESIRWAADSYSVRVMRTDFSRRSRSRNLSRTRAKNRGGNGP